MQTKSIFNNLYTSKYFEKLPDFKEKKTQAFLTIAFTLVTLAFFGIFAISPTLSTIANLQKQYSDNAFVEQQLNQKFANLNTLTQSYRSLESDLPFVFRAFPKTPDVTLFVGQLAALGIQNNVQINRVQTFEVELTKTQEGVQKFSTVSFSLDAAGDYQNLLNYLTSLTNFERIVIIDTISLTKGTDKDTNLTLGVRGKIFFKR